MNLLIVIQNNSRRENKANIRLMPMRAETNKEKKKRKRQDKLRDFAENIFVQIPRSTQAIRISKWNNTTLGQLMS